MRVKRQFIVAGVQEGSEAEKSGVKAGDEFVSVNGQSLHTMNSGEELRKLLAGVNPNQPIQLAFRRGDVALGVAVPPDTRAIYLRVGG